jgi:hypothetical protein
VKAQKWRRTVNIALKVKKNANAETLCPKTVQTVHRQKSHGQKPAVDTRSPVPLWELLTWAYRRQMVRYACLEGYGPAGHARGGYDRVGEVLRIGATIRTTGHGAPRYDVHEDAIVVHDWVLRLAPRERDLVMRTAEAGAPPDWNPRLPPCRVVPLLKGAWTFDNFKGPDGLAKPHALRRIVDKRGKWKASCIAYEGVGEAQKQARVALARRDYDLWHTALRVLRDAMVTQDDLKRWRITGVGAERTPWEPVVHSLERTLDECRES